MMRAVLASVPLTMTWIGAPVVERSRREKSLCRTTMASTSPATSAWTALRRSRKRIVLKYWELAIDAVKRAVAVVGFSTTTAIGTFLASSETP